MKGINFIALGLTCLLFGCANDNIITEQENDDCATENPVQTKDLAISLIVGKWNWIKTTYASRGTGTTIITPESTNKKMTYEFTNDKLKIYTNGDITNEFNYKVQFWGEGSNNVDEILVVKYDTGGTSILFINISGTCLRLVNSYNDVGGDLTLQKI